VTEFSYFYAPAAEQPPVITSNGGGATAALSVPENQGAGA
jgi:hypothetical protein